MRYEAICGCFYLSNENAIYCSCERFAELRKAAWYLLRDWDTDEAIKNGHASNREALSKALAALPAGEEGK